MDNMSPAPKNNSFGKILIQSALVSLFFVLVFIYSPIFNPVFGKQWEGFVVSFLILFPFITAISVVVSFAHNSLKDSKISSTTSGSLTPVNSLALQTLFMLSVALVLMSLLLAGFLDDFLPYMTTVRFIVGGVNLIVAIMYYSKNKNQKVTGPVIISIILSLVLLFLGLQEIYLR